MKMPNFDNAVDATYLEQCATSVMARALKPIWKYSVPFVHQSVSVLLPEIDNSRKDNLAHVFVMSTRLAKDLFFYGYMGAICGESHPLIRYAVAATSEETTGEKLYERVQYSGEGIVGTLCGIPVFVSDTIGDALSKGKHCLLRLTVSSESGQPEYQEVKSIYVEPFYADDVITRVDERLNAEEKAREQLIEEAQSAASCETIELVIPEDKTFDPDPEATSLRKRRTPTIEDDFAGDENRRRMPNSFKEKYVSMYDRYAESEYIRTEKWPRVMLESGGAAINLVWAAQALGENLAHVEWKDGTDSRLFLHINDDMFEQHTLDAFDLARYAGEIGIVLHNSKDFPYRTVDFAGVKYVSQTFKYVPGSKAKPQRVFTFSYATKTELCL